MIESLLPFAATATAAGISARWNWWRPVQAGGLRTLMYHKVGDPPARSQLKNLWVDAETFRWQMDYLLRKGFTPILFSELAAALDGAAAMPKKPVLVTFDDGYANNFEIAFPIMKELAVKSNIFLVYETIDHHNEWHNPETEPWVRMLTWKAILEMQESGLVEFGSHTMRHRHLPSISLEEAQWEMVESKKRLEEKLGKTLIGFAYPYGAGAYVAKIRQAARDAGYRFDFGIRQGISPYPWEPQMGPLKRLFIRGDDNRFDFHLQLTRGKSRL